MSAPLPITALRPVFTTRLFGSIEVPLSAIIDFPEALPGFPLARRFVVLQALSARLRWLQSLDDANLAFLLVEWTAVAPPLSHAADEAFAMVTLPARDEPATVNLAAPVLIGLKAQSGRQLIRTEAGLPTAFPFDLEGVLQAP